MFSLLMNNIYNTEVKEYVAQKRKENKHIKTTQTYHLSTYNEEINRIITCNEYTMYKNTAIEFITLSVLLL